MTAECRVTALTEGQWKSTLIPTPATDDDSNPLSKFNGFGERENISLDAAAAALPRNVSSRIALLIGIEASDRPTRRRRKRERNAAAAAAERMSAILIKGAAAEEGGDRGRKEGPFYFRANYADANGLQGARSGEGEAASILVRFPAERLRVRTLPLPLVIARTNCATGSAMNRISSNNNGVA